MRGLGRVHRGLCAISLVLALALGGCAAPATTGGAHAVEAAAPATATDTAAREPTPVSQAPTTAQPPMRTGGPLPADRADAPVALDTTCRTDADCAVKNVGNCCGYYPACVNVNSPTDPKGVQAECAKQGTMSVCGYQDIRACSCKLGQCEAAASDVVQ